MSILTSKTAICGLLVLLTLVSGVWLSHSGKPYSSMIFTIHKLIALATVIIIGVNVYHLFGTMDGNTLVALSVITVSGLLFLALFISGALLSLIPAGLLSLEKPMPEIILKIHQ
ncbi:MAG: hypothetical protein AB8I52_00990, partial [Candidatus Promineifilaceae bacterium]